MFSSHQLTSTCLFLTFLGCISVSKYSIMVVFQITVSFQTLFIREKTPKEKIQNQHIGSKLQTWREKQEKTGKDVRGGHIMDGNILREATYAHGPVGLTLQNQVFRYLSRPPHSLFSAQSSILLKMGLLKVEMSGRRCYTTPPSNLGVRRPTESVGVGALGPTMCSFRQCKNFCFTHVLWVMRDVGYLRNMQLSWYCASGFCYCGLVWWEGPYNVVFHPHQ